jgi:hypothetical protein
MTVIVALSSFREPGEMSPHKRACVPLAGQLDGTQQAHNCRAPTTVAATKQFARIPSRSIHEDSLVPNIGAGGSRCNAEVWQ